jgi:putative ABC transport system permease protein
VRTTGEPLAQVNAIRHAVHRLDPRLPVEHAQTLDQILDQSLSAERFRTFLLAAFAAVALLLAILGIGGLLSYSTAQRAQEFGVRIALGAESRDLVLLIFGQSLRLSVIGITVGLVASVAATRALSALLYDTSQYDVATFVGVPVLLALVALGASAIPAWRAAHADPIAALKAE